MNFRMTLGGNREEKHQGSEHYTEGYNAGYNNALEEMRRRSRGFAEPLHNPHNYEVEDRRGRRSRGEWGTEHMPMDDVHWPLEQRQIGFVPDVEDRRGRRGRGEYDENTEMLMQMMHELKAGQEQLKRGMTATAKKLDPHMEALLETATDVLENPPSTWESHMKRQDYLGIAKMEGKELLSALEAHKPVKEIRKELSHTLAALLMLAAKQ